ncbi:MAG TPA: hypothetical protein PK498_10445 [Candidatus Kapabacteria bacterium]|nr:hypothetical protein [Candidatus Kapabacteria bacterium]
MAKISPLFALDAAELFENGSYDDAISLCVQGIEQFPEYLMGYVTIIDFFIKIGNSQKAREFLDKYKQVSSNHKQISELEEKILSLETVDNLSTTEETEILPDIEQDIEETSLSSIFDAYQSELDDNELGINNNIDTNIGEASIDVQTEEVQTEIEQTEQFADAFEISESEPSIEEFSAIDTSIEELSIAVQTEEIQTEIEQTEQFADAFEISESETRIEEFPADDNFDENNLEELEEINIEQTPDIEENEEISVEHLNAPVNLPRGFLKAYASAKFPNTYSPKLNVEDKLLIDGLFDYLFYDFSTNQKPADLAIEASFDINSLISKYEQPASKPDEIQKLAEKISGIGKIEISEQVDEEIEEEPVDYIPPATETMAKILVQQGQFEKASQIYLTLAEKEPEKSDYYLEKAIEISEKINPKE